MKFDTLGTPYKDAREKGNSIVMIYDMKRKGEGVKYKCNIKFYKIPNFKSCDCIMET